MKKDKLERARQRKDDEFYTQLSDVEKELQHYAAQFIDKIVYCNCDNPEFSAFWEYFHKNFRRLGLKKLISTHLEREKNSYKMEYEGGNDSDIKAGIITPLAGNGDFRSGECINIMVECDIVITNPPFSLFRDYVQMLTNRDKRFLLIGNINAVSYKDCFPLIKDGNLKLGHNPVRNFKYVDGSIRNINNCYWFTNLDVVDKQKQLVLHRAFNPQEYQRIDNFEAINVDKTADIPVDYDGIMGVPVTYIFVHDPTRFDIVDSSAGWYGLRTKPYLNPVRHYPDGRVSNGNSINQNVCILTKDKPNTIYYTADNANGYLVELYKRIFIRKKR